VVVGGRLLWLPCGGVCFCVVRSGCGWVCCVGVLCGGCRVVGFAFSFLIGVGYLVLWRSVASCALGLLVGLDNFVPLLWA